MGMQLQIMPALISAALRGVRRGPLFAEWDGLA